MKKTIIASLLVAFAAFSSCQRAEPSDVLVLFSGLMVFHDKGSDEYEVGILKHGDHKFTVSVDGTDIPDKFLPKGTGCVLEIPGHTSTASTVGKPTISSRRPETDENHQYDFGWMIDLKEEFHPHDELELKEGYLDPIIQLPKGKISTKYKSYDLKRWQGEDPKTPNNTLSEFGFVPETIVLALKLRPEQNLVLRNGGKAVDLIPKPRHPFHVVVIKNAPNEYSPDSDFHHYYELFKDFDPKKRYNFEVNKDILKREERLHPKNPFPGYKNDLTEFKDRDALRTCCMMACTMIKLNEPLK